eukprot:1975028-Rhodomonas_salina.1
MSEWRGAAVSSHTHPGISGVGHCHECILGGFTHPDNDGWNVNNGHNDHANVCGGPALDRRLGGEEEHAVR